MKAKYLGLFGCGLLLCSSCSSIRHTADVAPVEAKIVNFTVADMNVKPSKATHTTSWSYNPFKIVSIDIVKANTEAELLNMTGCDVLVEPQYIVKKRGFLRGGSVTVTGYPAQYTNFHKMTPEESLIIKNAADSKDNKPKKKRWFLF